MNRMTGIESMHVWPENNGCEKQEVKRGCDITMRFLGLCHTSNLSYGA